MGKHRFQEALECLQQQYSDKNWKCYDDPCCEEGEKMYRWPGKGDEEILVVVHQASWEQEPFHRHEYFFFNYTYQGEYDSLSHKYDNCITIREKELYAGQPYAGHALCGRTDSDTIIIGILIRRDIFFHSFLPLLSTDSELFHFLLNPATDCCSDESIHFRVEDTCNMQALLEMMVREAAYPQTDTQNILKTLALAFLSQVAREYRSSKGEKATETLSELVTAYIKEHFDTVSLKEIAAHFSYHPNYISRLLQEQTGKNFSQLVLECRMERALVLLENTSLTVNEVALLLGYSNTSNFHKAFRNYYNVSPRSYMAARRA